jgi:hypothetical protein
MTNPSPSNPHHLSGLRTPVVVRFYAFLLFVNKMIDAERDLSGYSGQDPAVDAWIRDAENAHTATLGEAAIVMSLPALTEADVRLKAIARLFLVAMKSSDPDQMAYLRHRASQTQAFLLPWGDPVNFRLNQLILKGLTLFGSYAALDDGMIDVSPDETPDHGRDETAPNL